MSLSEVISSMHLSAFAEIPLVVFAIVFVLIVIRALIQPRTQVHHLAMLALDDSTGTDTHTTGSAPIPESLTRTRGQDDA